MSVDERIGDGGVDSGRHFGVPFADIDVGRCGVANGSILSAGSPFTSMKFDLTSCIISLPVWSVMNLPFSSRMNRSAIL